MNHGWRCANREQCVGGDIHRNIVRHSLNEQTQLTQGSEEAGSLGSEGVGSSFFFVVAQIGFLDFPRRILVGGYSNNRDGRGYARR